MAWDKHPKMVTVARQQPGSSGIVLGNSFSQEGRNRLLCKFLHFYDDRRPAVWQMYDNLGQSHRSRLVLYSFYQFLDCKIWLLSCCHTAVLRWVHHHKAGTGWQPRLLT